MAFRFYIVPTIGAGTFLDPRRPKYFGDGTVSGVWAAMDYGREPRMIVGADLSAADDTTLEGQADVLALPVDLDQTLTAGQVTAVQNKLEAINLPSAWVNTTRTWRYVLKAVLGIMAFMQRFCGMQQAALFSGTVSLDTTFNQLPVAVRNKLQQAAVSMGLDTTGLSGSTPIRTILRNVGQQLEQQPFEFSGVVL